jgi:hypothetical protein
LRNRRGGKGSKQGEQQNILKTQIKARMEITATLIEQVHSKVGNAYKVKIYKIAVIATTLK